MHKLAKKMADCLKAKVEGMGIDNIEGENLEELGKWVDIIKDIACYDKDMRIIEAMDEAEDTEESMRYIEEYEDYPEMRRGYRGQARDSRGRYMGRRGRGGRRGYENSMYDMMPIEWDRDMDREGMGKMYYSGSGASGSGMSGQSSGSSGMSGRSSGGNMGSSSDSGMRGYSESRYDRARRGYEETKSMHKDNSSESKQMKMKSLEDYTKELASDITDMVQDMSAEEKNLLRTKLQTLAQKVQ